MSQKELLTAHLVMITLVGIVLISLVGAYWFSSKQRAERYGWNRTLR